jgi:hypothetical protein
MAIGVKAFKFHLNKEMLIKFNSVHSEWQIKGQIVRTENLPGRNDVIMIGIKMVPETIPVSFKISIENYLKNSKDMVNSKLIQNAAIDNIPNKTNATEQAAFTNQGTNEVAQTANSSNIVSAPEEQKTNTEAKQPATAVSAKNTTENVTPVKKEVGKDNG